MEKPDAKTSRKTVHRAGKLTGTTFFDAQESGSSQETRLAVVKLREMPSWNRDFARRAWLLKPLGYRARRSATYCTRYL